ncbi:MAG: trehalase family glycosidase [Bacteroidales bacterium]|nr:trehalase family glycosidase [Bacteroidales bacterium]
MKLKLVISILMSIGCVGCMPTQHNDENLCAQYSQILDISHNPNFRQKVVGCYTDAGSWMGFTLPTDTCWYNGFCGPYSINERYFMSDCAVQAVCGNHELSAFVKQATDYRPGETYLRSVAGDDYVEQRLWFIDSNTALLHLKASAPLRLSSGWWGKGVELERDNNHIVAKHPSGEGLILGFEDEAEITFSEHGYEAQVRDTETYVTLSFVCNQKERAAIAQSADKVLKQPKQHIDAHHERWNGYLRSILRTDTPQEFNHVAVKSVVTLISNWRTRRGSLLHDGIVPSHAVGYFVGFWAWDCWKFSVALAHFEPELAKNNIRAMFDYQQPNGMIIDCIYVDPSENNYRDSKPPLAAWAVNEIYEQTHDEAFVREMFPQLVAYYRWWYRERDHDQNHLCEFGSVDGTTEAAAWESGMDNAVRFDDAQMVQNGPDAWSFDQESVDLNAYLAYENTLLRKFAKIIGESFDDPNYGELTAKYFYDPERGFFFDRRLQSGEFVHVEGCEAYIPFWSQIASAEQMKQALPILQDTTKFSTYIPFPTLAADHPKYQSNGYWRGPIWLDQTYDAIRGLRNYGYSALADMYTEQVFSRIKGLAGSTPINETYDSSNGVGLTAPHFSWSSAHLLLLYMDYAQK